MRKHIITTTLMCLVVALAFPIVAQHQTLGSLWPKVEENYPGIDAKIASIEAAKINEQLVKSNKLPQINAQAQNTYGTYEGSAGAFFPQAGFFNVSGPNSIQSGSSTTANTFGSTVIQWEAFSFGRLKMQNEAAETLSNKAVSEKDAYLLGLKKSLSERYISLLYNNAKLDWKSQNAERLQDIMKVTSGLAKSGLRPAADSLLASSSYIQALGDFDKWDGIKRASYIKLQELYGSDFIDYSLSAIRFIEPSETRNNPLSHIEPTHPVLNVLEEQSKYFLLSAEVQRKTSLPSINLLGGYSFRGTGINSNGIVSGAWKDGFTHPSHNVLAGIGITWNITNLYSSRLKSEKLLKDAESAKFLQTQYEQAMQADLSASQTKIVYQFKQLQKTKLAVAQSESAYNMYLARYKSGLIPLSELLQIRALLENAESAHIDASRDYWTLVTYEAELSAEFDFLFNNL